MSHQMLVGSVVKIRGTVERLYGFIAVKGEKAEYKFIRATGYVPSIQGFDVLPNNSEGVFLKRLPIVGDTLIFMPEERPNGLLRASYWMFYAEYEQLLRDLEDRQPDDPINPYVFKKGFLVPDYFKDDWRTSRCEMVPTTDPTQFVLIDPKLDVIVFAGTKEECLNFLTEHAGGMPSSILILYCPEHHQYYGRTEQCDDCVAEQELTLR